MNGSALASPSVILVEDEPHIRHFLRAALQSEKYLVVEASTLERGRIEAENRKPDLLIVDLGLPDGDGLELIGTVRAWSSMPILVLSARSEESDKVRALDLGADDYLTKPFGTAELLARVRALVRRALRARSEDAPVVHLGEVEVNLGQRTVTRAGEPVHLTPTEFKLLGHLIVNAGRVVTHRQLLAEVWGPNRVEHTHYLRVYMAGLRRKLERNPVIPEFILTESGIGYRLAI